MRKYKRFTYNLYNEDDLISFLEDESKIGWFLSRVIGSMLIFKKGDSKPLKYQLDYTQPSKEYENIKKELGYQNVCSLSDIYICSNENINAPDLQTDESSKILALLSCFDFKKIVLNIVDAMIWFLLFNICIQDAFFHFYRHSLGLFFTQIDKYIGLFLFAIIALSYFTKAIFYTIIYRYLKKQLDNPFEKGNLHIPLLKSCRYIENIYLMTFLLVILLFIPIPMYISFLIIISIFIYCLVFYLCSTKKYFRSIQIITLLTLLIMNVTIIQSQICVVQPIEKQLYAYLQVDNNEINEIKSLFANSKYINIFNDKYERYVICLNNSIANIVFKDEVITLDREYRKDKLITEYQEIGQDYDENDYPYLSYEKSLQNMKSYSTSLVGQCYYNEQYAICIKDNQVLSFRIQNKKNYIKNVLEYYYQ